MNFTSDIKREIISRSVSRRKKKGGKNLSAQKAALSAFIRTSGELGVIDGTPNESNTFSTELNTAAIQTNNKYGNKTIEYFAPKKYRVYS